LLLIALSVTAVAEDASSVYEVVADASIGPVFLTPSQRAWLDKRRLIAPTSANVNSVGEPDAAPPATSKKPAGFIVSSSGKRSEWSDGDFVESNLADVNKMRFPGEVKLLRHEHAANEKQEDDGAGETED
jgi:hypothetical protein